MDNRQPLPRILPQTIAMGGGTFESAVDGSAPLRRHPDWIKARIPSGETYQEVRRLLNGLSLHTVCAEAQCPNVGECWDQRTATIMILGDTCTRACGFCAVKTGKPTVHDLDEPRRVAEAIRGLGLDHVVVTSVARDDLAGEEAPLWTVMAAGPDILNHNVETVARLQKPVRKRARYDRSLGVLERAKVYARELNPSAAVHTKSSIMVGLGETRPELHQTFVDLRAVDCDILTVGQYLRPSPAHLPVERYYHPDEFAEMRQEALALGFKHVESGPLVRSSYHARDQVPDAEARRAERAARSGGASSAVAPSAPAPRPTPTIDADGRVLYRPD